uniref:Ribonuclease H-like domain, reverse transcriptase, RNA-dependent DNA polymerase n=1 Tax=Tanacetum cinerariifolium TaxID=118510 RepID=A0A699GJS6_TANCI|nr:ribonuclease H-like domain, reverse transcriptase, RNA-dependent DNA polymerase [Tanacetum cinerariifolium]
METSKPLMKDENAEDVDVHLYRSIIGSLMYLTSSRPDIMFADSPFNLEAYTDSDYVGVSLDRKFTTGGCQFLKSRLILWQCKKQTVVANYTTKADRLYTNEDWNEVKQWLRLELRLTLVTQMLMLLGIKATAMAKNINREAHIHAKVDGNKVIISEATIRKDLKFADEGRVDCLLNEVIFEQLPLMGLVCLQRLLEMRMSNDLPLSRVNTLRRGEDRLQPKELMELCTKLYERVLNLETTKTTQANEISSLKRRVKRLEKKNKSRTHGRKRLYKVGLSARVESSAEEQSLDEEDASKHGRNIVEIDVDVETTLVDETAEDQGRYNDQEMFDTRVLDDEEVVVKKQFLLKKLILLKIKGIVVRDHEEPSKSKTTTTPTSVADNTRPKAKGIVMKEPNYELAARLQEKEQGELTIEEKSRLFVELMYKRKKHFTKLKAKEKRRKPPTKAQKRNQMCVYLKNIVGFTHSQLKNKSFNEVKKMGTFQETLAEGNEGALHLGHISRNYTQPKQPQNSKYFKDKMMLIQAQGNEVALDEDQLLFITGGQDTVVDEDVDEQPFQDLALNVDNIFQANDCDAFDSDVDEAPTA